jgi:hypothetical protein
MIKGDGGDPEEDRGIAYETLYKAAEVEKKMAERKCMEFK